MKQAVSYLTEVFLQSFFLLESVCSDYLSRKEKWEIYEKLADVFCIDVDTTVYGWFDEAEKPHFMEIKDVPSYERFCRIIEFAEKRGQNVGMTEEDHLILSQKRVSVHAKSDIFKDGNHLTKEAISGTLLTTASNGNIDAMALLAFMEYHGICTTKDTYHALKRIRLCAKWNNTFGNLMGLAYDTANAAYYYNILYTVFRSENQKKIFKWICDSKGYHEPVEKDAVARIIERAFGLEIIKRNTYDQVFSKIAFSELISAEDKEKILLTKQKDLILSFADFPFDAKKEPELSFSASCTDRAFVKRTDELAAIVRNMTVSVRCPARVYKPLYIISPDTYMREMYADVLKAGIGEAHCIDIDASTLSMRDFSPDRENLFLRALSGTKTTQTVFLIDNCSETDEQVLTELLKMTDYPYRSHYKLSCPAITIDLSEIKFVFFSEKPVEELCEVSDTVRSQKISQSEKATVARSLFSERAAEYGVKKLTMDEACYDDLAGFEVSYIHTVIDEMIRDAVYRETDHISAECLRAFCAERSATKKDREFGFMGGTHHA